MRILYAIQGTGNGHLSRARAVVPLLKQKTELDLLVSGSQSEVELPFPIRYRYHGFSFLYNRKGGIHFTRSGTTNSPVRLIREITSLPVEKYDLVLNDFEPISAWACRLKSVPCVAIGHQAAFRYAETPRPGLRSAFGERVLRWYAPASQAVGFHFERYHAHIFPPVIRPEIRKIFPHDRGFYLVYLPAIDDSVLLPFLHKFYDTDWVVFSRYALYAFQDRNVKVQPVDSQAFAMAMAACTGVLTGAGFESPAEAMYLGKKLAVMPIRGQYEQLCNAASLARLDVPVFRRLDQATEPLIREWLASPRTERRIFGDFTGEALDLAIRLGRGEQIMSYLSPVFPAPR